VLFVLTHIIQICFRLIRPVAALFILAFSTFIQDTDLLFQNNFSRHSFVNKSYAGSSAPIFEIDFTNGGQEWFNADNEEIDHLLYDKRSLTAIEYFITNDIPLFRRSAEAVTSGSVSLLWLFAVF
jgi:hypothetical protein